jgi:hypothetical protein
MLNANLFHSSIESLLACLSFLMLMPCARPSCSAAVQVVQQQQQLQMSFAWSFLHVGQSMTANLFHSTSAVSGPKAARRLSERIVCWAMCSCIVLAFGTFTFRYVTYAVHVCLSNSRSYDWVVSLYVGGSKTLKSTKWGGPCAAAISLACVNLHFLVRQPGT